MTHHLEETTKKPLNEKNNNCQLVIINFCDDNKDYVKLADTLAKNWQIQYQTPPIYLDPKNFLKKKTIFQSQDSEKKQIKFCIIGHCNEGSDYIYANKKLEVHYTDLANAVLHYTGQYTATINLISCLAAKGKKGAHDSFAAKLHRTLCQASKDAEHKDIPVTARVTEIVISDIEGKRTAKFGKETEYRQQADLCKSLPPGSSQYFISADRLFEEFSVKHQLGSKIILMSDNGQQKQVDAYAYKWRIKLITCMDKIKEQTSSVKIKNILGQWAKQFASLNEKEILHVLKKELPKFSSAFNENIFSLFSFFGMKSAEYHELQSLIQEGKNIFNSPYTQPTQILNKL